MKPNCLCGCPEEAHDPESLCEGCRVCVRYRPVVLSPREQWERLVAEQMALAQMPVPGRVQ